MRKKATDDNFNSQHSALEDGDVIYAMGPRAAMEVGRKQVIHFCADVLDVEADPTMLREVEEDIDENDEIHMEDAEA